MVAQTSVMIVDQDTKERVGLCHILERDGYRVVGAASYREALARKSWSEFGVVILDAHLPDGKTGDMLPRLKELAPAALFVVAATPDDLDATMAASGPLVADYVLKPFHADLLRVSLSRLARMHDAERRAHQNERLAAIGQMVTAIAHESRNSLQRIQSAVELMSLDLQDSPYYQKELCGIERAADNIRALLDEIRTFAAPIVLEREPASLVAVWRSAWSEAIGLRQPEQVRLSEHGSASNLTCWVDRRRMTQVFRNLFDNSLAACAESPQVAIHCVELCESGQNMVRISVRDNGRGFADAYRARAFEPFATTKQKGTGLGMAIVKRIVEAHGGSVALGANGCPGAEVIVMLPRGRPERGAARMESKATQSSTSSSRRPDQDVLVRKGADYVATG